MAYGSHSAKVILSASLDTIRVPSDTMEVLTWVLLVTVLVLLWAYSRWRHSYWSSRGIVTPPVIPFIGHSQSFMGKRWLYVDKYYHKFREHKVFGLYEFLNPSLVVSDLELLKHVMVKDFDHFVDRRLFGDQPGSIMHETLPNKQSEEWKDLRALMSPTFSSGKMRGMFHLICEKADNLVSYALKKAADNSPVDMKDVSGRFTMDTMASCAFGMECNSLSDEAKPIFVENAEKFFTFEGWRGLRLALLIIMPRLFSALGLKADTPEIEFLTEVSRENMAARKSGQTKRGDFLDLLLEAKDAEEKQHPGKRVFNERTLVAQSVVFLIAGYDTTASLLSFATSLIARHPKEQRRLRQEMQGLVREHGSITYQGVMEAKYLDACISEALRMYSPGIFGERLCTREYKVPGTDLILHPGDLIIIPYWSIHHDPQYWSSPEEFRPDRFLAENRDEIKSFSFMPFGMGPRNCLAMRFALMESKVALAHLVLAADIKPAPEHKITFENSPFLLRPKDGVHVLLTPHKEE